MTKDPPPSTTAQRLSKKWCKVINNKRQKRNHGFPCQTNEGQPPTPNPNEGQRYACPSKPAAPLQNGPAFQFHKKRPESVVLAFGKYEISTYTKIYAISLLLMFRAILISEILLQVPRPQGSWLYKGVYVLPLPFPGTKEILYDITGHMYFLE